MDNEALLTFRRLNEEVEKLRQSLKAKDEMILNLQQNILKLEQELILAKQNNLNTEEIQTEVSEASRSFL